MFDLDQYLAERKVAITKLAQCKVLSGIVATEPECDLAPSVRPFFATCVNTVVNQLISYKAALTIEGRLQNLAGDPISEQAWLAADQEALRACGLSRSKLLYCTLIAEQMVAGELSEQALWQLPTAELAKQLQQIKGFGRWSVEMMLMFHFGRLDVFAPQDVGLQRALLNLGLVDDQATLQDYEAAAQRWAPYRSVASWYLWQSVK